MKRKNAIIALTAILAVGLLCYVISINLFRGVSARTHKTTADKAPTSEVYYRPLWVNQDRDTSGLYSLYRISAMKVDKLQNIYVVDGGNNRIMKYDSAGIFIQQIGRAGQGPGELLDPSDLDFDEEGFIYITNKGNNRIEIFTPKGSYFHSFKIHPSITSYHHASIAVGSHGEIFLNLPTAGYLVTVFSKNGERLRQFGTIKSFATPLETYLFNWGSMEFDREANVLYFMFTARPMFQMYDSQGGLLIAKVVDGLEVRRAFKAWERNKKKARPGTVGWMVFFYDLLLLPNKHLLASTEIGPCLYEFDSEGDVVRKFVLAQKQEKCYPEMLAYLTENSILLGDGYHNSIAILE